MDSDNDGRADDDMKIDSGNNDRNKFQLGRFVVKESFLKWVNVIINGTSDIFFGFLSTFRGLQLTEDVMAWLLTYSLLPLKCSNYFLYNKVV